MEQTGVLVHAVAQVLLGVDGKTSSRIVAGQKRARIFSTFHDSYDFFNELVSAFVHFDNMATDF